MSRAGPTVEIEVDIAVETHQRRGSSNQAPRDSPKNHMCADHISSGHQKSEAEHRLDICTAGNWLYERGFIPACDGNITIRLDAGRILATPRGFCKGMMNPDDLVITDRDGRKISGKHEPSSELEMHLLIYRRRLDANAVCHAHHSHRN